MCNTITFRQLRLALSRLGFSADGEATRYRHHDPRRDALVILPDGSPEGVVPIHYLAAARDTVFWKGIASRRDFDEALSDEGGADDALVSTAEAAAILNVSEPYVIKMLDEGGLPARTVGTDRCVLLSDVRAHREHQDAESEAALSELAAQAQELGMGYNPGVTDLGRRQNMALTARADAPARQRRDVQFNIRVEAETKELIVLSDRDYELFTKIMTEEHEPTELALRGAAGFMSGTMEGPRYRW